MNEPAVPMDERLTAYLVDAAEAAGFPARTMPSGAGHDAMVMATRLPPPCYSFAAREVSATIPPKRCWKKTSKPPSTWAANSWLALPLNRSFDPPACAWVPLPNLSGWAWMPDRIQD